MKGYLKFKKQDGYGDGEKIFDVINHEKEKLGQIYYKEDWDQYVFESEPDCYYSYDCLDEISRYLQKLNKK
jgi:hypothetical protein